MITFRQKRNDGFSLQGLYNIIIVSECLLYVQSLCNSDRHLWTNTSCCGPSFKGHYPVQHTHYTIQLELFVNKATLDFIAFSGRREIGIEEAMTITRSQRATARDNKKQKRIITVNNRIPSAFLRTK